MKIAKKPVQSVLLAIAFLLIIGGGSVSALVHYLSSEERSNPLVFSKNTMLYELWQDYKRDFIEPNTYRALDRSQNNITTSEGQSYSMLRAVWMDDRETFDKSWLWTKQNLQRPDHLISWKFGQLTDGTYGIQRDQGGYNTATDADSDIALSLLMAYTRWNEPKYLDEAKPIISSIWDKNVIHANGKPVLAANDLEKTSSSATAIINPSYFSPYAYRIFASVDTTPGHDWNALVTSSYDILQHAARSPIDKTSSVGLPPDWMYIHKVTGEITATSTPHLTTNYGYDALRTPWRIALDHQWFGDPRAKETLKQMGHLQKQWDEQSSLKAVYSHDGQVVDDYETAAMYGGSLGYFSVLHPQKASQIIDKKLSKTYDPDAQAANTKLQYYDANWSWFGIALHEGALPNLTKQPQ